MTTSTPKTRFRSRSAMAVVLVILNLALIAANLDKHDLLPVSFGLASTSSPDSAEPTVAVAPTVPDDRPEPTETTVTEVVTEVAAEVDQTPDDWPGGRGPVPEGPPIARRATIEDGGRLELTGSAPDWATVTRIVESAGNTLPGGIDAVDNRLTWHPEASSDVQSGDVSIEQGATFALGQAVIEPSSFPTLDLAAELLQSRPSLFVVVIGHTDSVGDDEANAQLALDRATAVVDYLTDAGVVPGQLVVASAGEDDPTASNETEAGREVNRRIELQFKNFYIGPEDFGRLGQ